MANNKLLVNERQIELGNFVIGRFLPFRKKRQVGPFTFVDHTGPSTIGNGQYIDVDQHPHIGLCTLTYLLQGEIEHKDSMGNVQMISAGDVALMTAGSGVTHTERTPVSLREGPPFVMHGYQIWLALPADMEKIAPRFDYFPSSHIPIWQKEDLFFRLLAGKAFGKQSPLQGYSPLYMLDIESQEKTLLNLRGQILGEVGFIIVRGSIMVGDQVVEAGQMLISKTDSECEINMEASTQILLFGGQPLEQEPLLLWNFVSHDKALLQEAKARWIARDFPPVPGDDTYIPFPGL